MVRTRFQSAFIVLILLVLCNPIFTAEKIPAFPGAEGYGALTPGGRGGRVVFVTNLQDYVPGEESSILGSFRAACETEGPRIVVFNVSGIIELKAPLTITEPFITIAGQTAPEDGICLKNYACIIRNTHDVIIRYLRVRPGDSIKTEVDALSTHGSQNVIIDHCSASWGNDEVLSVSGSRQNNITVQWCMITESLDDNYHHKGRHGYGSLLRTDGNVTFHHNLYAHHRTRCPRPGTYNPNKSILLDFRNNVIYNWITFAGYSARDSATLNYVANYLKPGPSTKIRDYAFNIGGKSTKMFVANNVLEGVDIVNGNDWKIIKGAKKIHKANQPFPAALVKTETAEMALQKILNEAGATLPVRDAVDMRIVNHVKNGTGRVINSQDEVGGWPKYKSTEPPKDSDKDGMPDDWEARYELDPHNNLDTNGDNDKDGYTNIEEYLNGTNPLESDID